jgi:hypothetical protein
MVDVGAVESWCIAVLAVATVGVVLSFAALGRVAGDLLRPGRATSVSGGPRADGCAGSIAVGAIDPIDL